MHQSPRRRAALVALIAFIASLVPAVASVPALASADSRVQIATPGEPLPPGKGEIDPSNPPAISKDRAVEIVLQAFPAVAGMQLQSANYQPKGPGQPAFWWLNWRSQTERGDNSAYANVDADTGSIRNFSLSGPETSGRSGILPVISRARAKEIALELMRRLQPAEAEQVAEPLVIVEGWGGITGPSVYPVFAPRLVNGIEFAGNSFSVNVDASSGQVQNYSFNWTDVVLPDPDQAITREAALALISQQAPLQLAYFPDYSAKVSSKLMPVPNGVPRPRLVWNYLDQLPLAIDALTGDFLDYQGNRLDIGRTQRPDFDPATTTPTLSPLPEPLDQQGAIEAASVVQLPDGWELTSVNYNEWQPGPDQVGKPTKVWYLNYRGPKQEGDPDYMERNASVTVDAVSGKVTNYWRYTYREGDKDAIPVLTVDEAAQKADAFLARVVPEIASTVWRQPLLEPEGGWGKGTTQFYFNYAPLIGGIPYYGASVNVSVDTRTGEVVGYYFNWTGDLEGTTAKVSAEQAFAALTGGDGQLTRLYVQFWNYSPNRKPEEPAEPTIKLIWAISDPNERRYGGLPSKLYVDAATGDVLNSGLVSLRENALRQQEPEDVLGRPDAAQILAVLSRNLMDLEGGKFNPDRPVTRIEAIQTLLRLNPPVVYREMALNADMSFGDVPRSSPYFETVQQALNRGIVKFAEDFRPDDPVTQAEMAVMFVRTLGHGDLEKADPSYFNLPTAGPVPAWARIGVSLASALGLFEPDQFAASGKVSRADLARMIVRASQIVQP